MELKSDFSPIKTNFGRLFRVISKKFRDKVRAKIMLVKNCKNVAEYAECVLSGCIEKAKKEYHEQAGVDVKKSKKPAIVFSNYDDRKNPYYGGGGAIAIHETAKRMAESFEVHVITGKYPNCANREIIDGVRYERIGSALFGPKIGQIIFHFSLPFSITRKKFDLWIESFTPPFSTSFLPLFTSKPVIGLAHMLSGRDMCRKYKIPFFIIENIGIRIYDDIIATSKESAEKIKIINPRARVAILPNGVNMRCLSEKFDKKHFLYIGRLEINQKGLDLLLGAFAFIKDKKHPLVIAGSGPESEKRKLDAMIKRFNLKDYVKLVGRVEGREKERILGEALAVIIPSRYETFSLAALEALVSGAFLACFDIEGLKWIPDELCFKVRPFDEAELSRVLKVISESASPRPNVEKLADFLRAYDWKAIASEYEKYFNFILDQRYGKP